MKLPSALYKAKLEYGKAYLLEPALIHTLDKYSAFYEVPEARDILKCIIENWYHVNMINLGYRISDCESFIQSMYLVNGYDQDSVRYVFESLAYALGQRKTVPDTIKKCNTLDNKLSGIDYLSFKMISDAAIGIWNTFVETINNELAMSSLMFNLYFENLQETTPDINQFEIDCKMMLLSDVKTCTCLYSKKNDLDVTDITWLAYLLICIRMFESKKNVSYEELHDYITKYTEKIQSINDYTKTYCEESIHYKKKGPYYFTELLEVTIIPQFLLQNYQNDIKKLEKVIRTYGS